VTIKKNSQLLLIREMYNIYCETRIKLTNMPSGQNAVLSLLRQMVDLQKDKTEIKLNIYSV